MLKLKKEMAILSGLYFTYTASLIEAYIKRPNICIMTKLVKQGNLKELFYNITVKLAWQTYLKLLCFVAKGINYLYNLDPIIIYRDFKSFNLLVTKD